MAEWSTLPTRAAASRSEKRRISWARSASCPRTRSSTSRTLYADMRTYRATARVEVDESPVAMARGGPSARWRRTGRSLSLGPVMRLPPPRSFLAGVEAERPRQCELAQFVADHGLGDVDGHVLAAVV